MLCIITGPLAAFNEILQDQLPLWLQVFTLDTLRYLVGAGLVSSVLGGFGAWSENRRIQDRRASAADVRRELLYSLLTTAVYASVALFTIQGKESGWLNIYESVADFGWWYTCLSLPLVLVLHDAWFYWVHRALHHPRVFHWAHRVHHLSRTPTPWAAYSFAPAEAFMMALFLPLLLAVMPLHPAVLFLFLAVMILRNAMGHSGCEFHPRYWVDTPLDRLTTTTHHDMHHQKFNGNYGLYFTWWDRWMGTELPGYKAAFRRAAAGRDVNVTSVASALEL
ncbi:MAG: sterol desaturase family protein [Gammaproteobacteria bacterium]|nr:sterol desaturase family protein [Gammaproteobacteria bacterium]